jgi:PEP-CTERM motif
MASLTILCLALVAIPAWADYSNGPINGTTDAWTINFGFVVSNSVCCRTEQDDSGGGIVTGFMFGVWEFPGDTMSSVDWSLTTGENSGMVLGSGTASGFNLTDKFISSNEFGFNIDEITVTGLNVNVGNGANPYWLNLQNAVVPSGDPVYWDENSGVGCTGDGCPSSASESSVGTIPSEAFTINSSGGTSGSTPEPSSILLFGSGILGLAGLLRRRLFL